MKLESDQKLCFLAVTGAFLESGRKLEGVRLEISNWRDLQMHQESGSLSTLSEELADICEFDLQEDSLRVAGFYRKAHGYLEMTFQEPTIEVLYVSDSPLA
ncbi:hypothetical protein A2G07_05980 [Deinococcus radiodurans R1 = ATCC 13939 = DSM 20539]|jgi:hypothetical protein|nr:hypothetical protein A2G07_05980 [Deinococcus radiodurans R1 = ATCC 13939 = DSM 20539]